MNTPLTDVNNLFMVPGTALYIVTGTVFTVFLSVPFIGQ